MLETITEAESLDLTTLAAVKLELSITGNVDDAKLSRWITAASGMIHDYTRRTFPAQTYRETFRPGERRDTLLLSRYPVVEIDTIVENGTTLAADDAEAHADSGQLVRLSGDRAAWWACGKIVVTYSAGYATRATMPPAIGRAAIALVHLLRSSTVHDPLVRSKSIEGVMEASYQVGGFGDGALPPDIAGMLAPHRDFRAR